MGQNSYLSMGLCTRDCFFLNLMYALPCVCYPHSRRFHPSTSAIDYRFYRKFIIYWHDEHWRDQLFFPYRLFSPRLLISCFTSTPYEEFKRKTKNVKTESRHLTKVTCSCLYTLASFFPCLKINLNIFIQPKDSNDVSDGADNANKVKTVYCMIIRHGCRLWQY